MQDEVREKSVAFVIRVGKTGGKLTASMLKYAMEQCCFMTITLQFRYYDKDQSDSFSFYRIPKPMKRSGFPYRIV